MLIAPCAFVLWSFVQPRRLPHRLPSAVYKLKCSSLGSLAILPLSDSPFSEITWMMVCIRATHYLLAVRRILSIFSNTGFSQLVVVLAQEVVSRTYANHHPCYFRKGRVAERQNCQGP